MSHSRVEADLHLSVSSLFDGGLNGVGKLASSSCSAAGAAGGHQQPLLPGMRFAPGSDGVIYVTRAFVELLQGISKNLDEAQRDWEETNHWQVPDAERWGHLPMMAKLKIKGEDDAATGESVHGKGHACPMWDGAWDDGA